MAAYPPIRVNRNSCLESPTGYLYRVALKAHRSRLRRAALRAKPALHLSGEVGGSVSDPVESLQERDEVARMLSGLPRGQREALILVEWLGMDPVQAARILGVAPTALRMRLSRARSFLRERWRGEIRRDLR